MPRFGHGAFLLCLENLYKKVTGRDMVYTALIGKPSEITYRHAEHVLQQMVSRHVSGDEHPTTLLVSGRGVHGSVPASEDSLLYRGQCVHGYIRGKPLQQLPAQQAAGHRAPGQQRGGGARAQLQLPQHRQTGRHLGPRGSRHLLLRPGGDRSVGIINNNMQTFSASVHSNFDQNWRLLLSLTLILNNQL